MSGTGFKSEAAKAALLFSPRMQSLYEEAQRCARHCRAILIEGETGTGKELLARAIHAFSVRAQAALVVENCSSLQEELAESELFGYRKGAFSGADRDRSGLFDIADGGALFLDELQDLSPAVQGKLLRVLETGEFRRVGAQETTRVDVIFIGAMSARASILRDDFQNRFDYRFRIPPLRERREEIEPFARHFAFEAEVDFDLANTTAIDEEAIELLTAQEWPGNVRQLRKAIRRTLLRSGCLSANALRDELTRDEGVFISASLSQDADLLRRYGSDYPQKLAVAVQSPENLDQIAASMNTTRRTLTKHLQILGLPTRGARRRR